MIEFDKETVSPVVEGVGDALKGDNGGKILGATLIAGVAIAAFKYIKELFVPSYANQESEPVSDTTVSDVEV